MWIRSQNGDTLTRYDLLEIVDFSKGVYVVTALANGGPYQLGEYTTKEKASKVLDKIQFYLENETRKVFQMPQDDEVEV